MKKKILLIDDDNATRFVMAAYLEGADFEIAQSGDGKEGIATALRFKPDLVITDLMMPKMHGYQVCEKLHGDESLKDLHIIVMSSKSYGSDIELALEAGADAYFIKPYRKEDLLAKISELLSPQ